MALKFFADIGLTLPIGTLTPKRILLSSKGGNKKSQIWLGDPYSAVVAATVAPAASEIFLDQTSEFLTRGTVVINSQTITYTGKTQSKLTGVSGVIQTIDVGDTVYPSLVYSVPNSDNLEMFQSGSDRHFGVQVALATSENSFGFPGMPAIFNLTSVASGVTNAVPVFISISVPAGPDREFTDWGIQSINLYLRDVSDSTPFSNTEGTYAPVANGYLYRHDQSLPVRERIYPSNRRVSDHAPGFIIGQYRWRDDNTRNATALLPTHWDVDPNALGLEKFIAGMGDRDDLESEGLIEVGDSIYMDVNRGHYFTGAFGYYLPADPVLEFLPCSAAGGSGPVTLPLLQKPRSQAPMFVGTYALDSSGFYDKNVEYSYAGTVVNPDGTARTDLPDLYFTLDRITNTITLSKPRDNNFILLGLISGNDIDYFDLPIYPVDNILRVYVDQGPSAPPIEIPLYTFDREQGTLQIPLPDGALKGEPVYASCSPAVAVLYDAGPDEAQRVTKVDFNPAFSGIANGFMYLQHSRQKPTALVLSCDKPRILVPASLATIIGLVAFGPVYFDGDFALLSVTAYSAVAGQVIPNAKLDVVIDPTNFSGTINYLDPTIQTVSLVTGGDGTANFIYTPAQKFGTWLPTTNAAGSITNTSLGGLKTTNITHDTLVLPTVVPINQLWNSQDGWLVKTYTVIDNDPLLGMVGADPTLGEVPWITSGTPGGINYKTNGERDLWVVGNSGRTPILPIDALDIHGVSYTHGTFTGTVKQLVYPASLPSTFNIGAYFLSFVQNVTIQVRLENSNVVSNTILLQMAIPDVILENPWLIIDDQFQGLINQYRLGWSNPVANGV